MSLTYEELYRDLQAELGSIRSGQLEPVAVIEAGFQAAWRYRQRLPLPDVAVSMIEYYKKWLPRFDAELRYFECCYYAEKFCHWGSARDRQEFWQRERKRGTRQLDQAPVLYAYCRSGATDLDGELFGRDEETARRNAELLATLLALERYDQYLDALDALYFNSDRL